MIREKERLARIAKYSATPRGQATHPTQPRPPRAVAAIKAAADLLAEGRQYLELRGTITGELDSPTTMINPIFGEQRIQVLAFPKCADVREHVPLDATNKPD